MSIKEYSLNLSRDAEGITIYISYKNQRKDQEITLKL